MPGKKNLFSLLVTYVSNIQAKQSIKSTNFYKWIEYRVLHTLHSGIQSNTDTRRQCRLGGRHHYYIHTTTTIYDGVCTLQFGHNTNYTKFHWYFLVGNNQPWIFVIDTFKNKYLHVPPLISKYVLVWYQLDSWRKKLRLRFGPNCSDTYVLLTQIHTIHIITSLKVELCCRQYIQYLQQYAFQKSNTSQYSRSSSKLMRKCFIDNWISSFALRHYSTEAFLLHQECTTVFTMIVGGIPKDLVK